MAALDLAKWRQETGYARIARRERRRLRDWRELVCLGLGFDPIWNEVGYIGKGDGLG